MNWPMFLAGVLLMTLVLLRRAYIYYRGTAKRKSGDSVTLSLPSTPRTLQDAPPEYLRWQVEMHEMSRSMKAELDSKMRALQVLIRMADERIERLEQHRTIGHE